MKIDKARLFKGKKGTYLNIVVIETPNNEFSDFMIVESISKKEHEAGKKGTILGNLKSSGVTEVSPETEYAMAAPPVGSDDLPF